MREINEGYLRHVRSLPCLICLKRPPSDPHHTQTVATGGSDYLTIPLCRRHHSKAHTVGRETFAKLYSIDLFKEARKIREKYLTSNNG